ncbi:hypothetical protein [Gandjariella thermophila]|uniref:Uncharacterized protein n=1 Tax=Gandjariella thermophila TaxID=1931992 RepID=A0A4D4JDE5_9PSEU|nr:hypothetical protein GTS_43110 [Gandjariella thermophila]
MSLLEAAGRPPAAAYGLHVSSALFPNKYAFVAETVREVFGPHRFQEMEHPLAGAEDFSRVLQAVPGRTCSSGRAWATTPSRRPTTTLRWRPSTTACSPTARHCWPNSPPGVSPGETDRRPPSHPDAPREFP